MKSSLPTKGHIYAVLTSKWALNRSIFSRQKSPPKVTPAREKSLVGYEEETILEKNEGKEPIYAEEN